MNTNRLKLFATQARTRLMQGVTHRLTALGFRADGSVIEQPQQQGGGATFMGGTVSEDFFEKWQSLYKAVERHGIRQVAEEAAYTWFNRLVAIRIMVRNGLIAPVLEFEAVGSRVPVIVAEARQGRLPEMDDDTRRQLTAILDDDSRTDEQFAMLITAFCHSNLMLYSCFGRITDYTEMLLPLDILADGGFVAMLNDTDFIDDDDYLSPELIGWLYQFYISERKDEVMAKKGKYAPDEIPAATQIFTPNWIVKYMVQNTVGRIYLDNNPDVADDLKSQWKYLVEPADGDGADHVLHCSLDEMKVADLACGSGHILNECFDMLYDLYVAEGFSRRQAIENIFANNLTGIDIDTRAKQLATFALLLKACQKDKSFADAHAMPRVLDMPKADRYTWRDLNGHMACALQLRGGGEVVYQELDECFALMEHADSLGSIMKFHISPSTRDYILLCFDEQKRQQKFVKEFAELFKGFELILALTEKYSALIANPPYMGKGKMEPILSDYLDRIYPNAKADLFATFMEAMIEKTDDNGRTAFITMESWMFLSSFEAFRNELLNNIYISSLGHFGWHIIGIAFGTVMMVIQKALSNNRKGQYSYLTIEDIDRERNVPFIYPKKDNGRFAVIPQTNFCKIPGSPIGYWVKDDTISIFNNSQRIKDFADVRHGMSTGKNELFVRLWHEVSRCDINVTLKKQPESLQMSEKYVPYNKGGDYRKWFGNASHVLRYDKQGQQRMSNLSGHRHDGKNRYFEEGITWSFISSNSFGVRYTPTGFSFDVAGSSMFMQNEKVFYVLAVLCSKLGTHFMAIMNPTFNFQVGNLKNIPIVEKNHNQINSFAQKCIAISRADWDAHETSWDFQCNELLTIDEAAFWEILNDYCEFSQCDVDPAPPEPQSLEWRTDIYKMKWRTKLLQLHSNEEELNRQFIDIYGLQDELTPDVPLDEVTILQQGEISIADSAEGTMVNRDKTIPYDIIWHDDVLMKQFISYAVGCMMGRYSIDKPGLILANQGDGIEQYYELVPNSRFEVDDDGIIPLMPSDTWFNDNATLRFKRFVETVFGSESLNENLNFIEQALGKSIDAYFVKDFWKDHKKMYQNRPIYWLFSSKKGAFQCVTYMHRMNAYTVERIRSKYLLPHIEWLVGKAQELEAAPTLTTPERKQLDSLHKQIAECREYHDRLHVVADKQIAFDLDDGVVVNYAKFGDILAKIK